MSNFWPAFKPDAKTGEEYNFAVIYGILYNACTGVLSGSSLSGDLRDPGKSITTGTLWAIVVTFVGYVGFAIMIASTVARSTLYENLSFLEHINFIPAMIAVGIYATALFSTLGCMISAAAVLPAMAQDRIHPFLSIFRPSSFKYASYAPIVVTWFLTQASLFIGDLNTIAPLVTMMFLLSYGILNLACLALVLSGAPNFRPQFRYFKWWTAFIGVVFSFASMFLVNTLYAIISLIFTALIFVTIYFYCPAKEWGDITQSLIYHQVRKYLLRLDIRKQHVKFWRPQVRCFVILDFVSS